MKKIMGMKRRILKGTLPILCTISLILVEPMSVLGFTDTLNISGNIIGGNIISENNISGNDISGNDISGNDISENEFNIEQDIDEVSGNEVNQDEISENEANDNQIVSQNDVADEIESVENLEFDGMALTSNMISEKKALSMRLDEYKEMLPGRDYVENQVVFLSDSLEEAKKIAECYQAELSQYEYGVAVISANATAKEMVTAAANPDNDLPPVYYNDILTMDEEDSVQSGACDEQWFHDYIGSKDSWEYTYGDDVLVAVIDTGVRYTHQDLMENCVAGYDFVNDDEDPMDDQGHGTHVAGIIAAVSANSIGGCGVSPAAKIMPLKVLGADGSGTQSSIMTAIGYAVDHQADIINLSLGNAFYSECLQQVINKAVNQGVPVVCAAGNEGSEHMHYPAAYDGAISVAALLDTNGIMKLREASNYGNWVDIAAPGSDIYATVYTSDTAYGYKSGTSMAAPVVAGTIALMMSVDSNLKGTNAKNVTKVETLLKNAQYQTRYYNSAGGSVYGGVYAAGATGGQYYKKLTAPAFLPSDVLNEKKNIIGAGDQGYDITIDSLPGSRVYYTTNGKTPTEKSTLYTAPIPVKKSGKLTLKAIAYMGNKKSAVATKTFQLEAKATNLEFYSGEQYKIARGKYIKLSPVFTPSYTTNKGLVYQSSNPDIRVNSAGSVYCRLKARVGSSAVITATTTDGSNLSVSTNVVVIEQATNTLTLNAKEIKLSAYPTEVFPAGNLENEFRLMPTVTGDQPTGFLYSTTNKKVATVDSSGLITAVGKGNAIITVRANDGSAKQKICKVKVVMPVYQIHTIKTSTGFNDSYLNVPIGLGNTIRLTAYQNENYKCVTNGTYDKAYIASDTKMIWSSNSPYLSVNKTTGTVKCKKDAPVGATALITARAHDGYGASQSVLFKIEPRVKKITSTLSKEQKRLAVAQTSSMSLTKEQILDSCVIDMNMNGTVTTTTTVIHNHVIDFIYQSQVGKYLLCGTRPGTAKIRISDANGSGKYCTITFTVKE